MSTDNEWAKLAAKEMHGQYDDEWLHGWMDSPNMANLSEQSQSEFIALNAEANEERARLTAIILKYAPPPPQSEREKDGELKLRMLLATCYAGTALYGDDGELQDARELPFIDFKRMTPDQIESAMQERGLNRLRAAMLPASPPIPCRGDGSLTSDDA